MEKRARQPVSHETSAGVIVFHDHPERGRLWLTLLHGKGHWDFAKGHVEQGETVGQTAIRELHEETGLEPDAVELLDGFNRRITYWFTGRGQTRIHKNVHYFVGRSASDHVVLSAESEDFAWLPLDECVERLSFSTARTLLKDAAAFLERKGI